jgi:glycosyltransferase involved in cell wall biosynthesis
LKKVLIITYYWPPAGGSGVQRWAKMVKYLRQYGWEPIVFTVENGEYPAIDTSLEKDIPRDIQVIRRPVFEVYSLYRKLTGRKSSERTQIGVIEHSKQGSWKDRLALWIRSNFFIPDARMFWIRPSVKYLVDYLKDNPVDAVISSAPPYSAHLIASGLKKRLGVKWIADFRDPWTRIFYFRHLSLTRKAENRHKHLERTVLKAADEAVVVGNAMKKQFESILERKYEVIYNGFDEADYDQGVGSDSRTSDVFTITYVGSFTPTQNPENLWKALKELYDENTISASDFSLQLIGKIHPAIIESIEKHGIMDLTDIMDYMPHSELVPFQRKASVLLLCINDVEDSGIIITGKFFEYLAAKRPILCIAPGFSEVQEIIGELNAGSCFSYEYKRDLKDKIRAWIAENKEGRLTLRDNDISRFTRRVQAGQFAQLLDKIV